MTKKQNNDKKAILLTAKGFEKLKAELEELKTEGRKKISLRLKEAISYGDLSENAEYDEAKNQQSFLEARILELENQVVNIEIIEEKKSSGDIVGIGSTVTLNFIDTNEKHEYSIVGITEADPIMHKISNESPVGSAILGKKVKDKVEVKAPGGVFSYEILAIK
jgi:transcription elongation factor GreA